MTTRTMPGSTRFRSTFTTLLLPLAIFVAGCETLGEGITAREFDERLETLAPGTTQEAVLELLGEPRDRLEASEATDADSVWVYSRMEKTGTRTVINEGALGPGGAGIPSYEEEDVNSIIQFRLFWQDGAFVRWERFEPKSRF
jgi:hypothetical protein